MLWKNHTNFQYSLILTGLISIHAGKCCPKICKGCPSSGLLVWTMYSGFSISYPRLLLVLVILRQLWHDVSIVTVLLSCMLKQVVYQWKSIEVHLLPCFFEKLTCSLLVLTVPQMFVFLFKRTSSKRGLLYKFSTQ